MSRSFMDSIRGVVSEGAKEKTADGMTKDAKHFRTDLHQVKDAGMKHLVQKDSETKDYEKMFSGDVDHAKARLADQQAPEDLNKYVEYNEHLEIEEAKKEKEEKHDDDCNCDDCSETMEEQVMGGSAPAMAQRASGVTPNRLAKSDFGGGTTVNRSAKSDFIPPKSKANINLKSMPGKPLSIGQVPGGLGVQSYNSDITRAAKPPTPVSPAAREPSTPKKITPTGNPNMAGNRPAIPSNMSGGGTMGTTAARQAADAAKSQTSKMSGGGTMGTKPVKAPIPTAKPVKPAGGSSGLKKQTTSSSGAKVKPTAAKPTAVAPAKPKMNALQQQMKRSKSGRDAAVTGPIRSSFEIDINGTSYLVSEAHASAIAAFVEKYGEINEGTAGDFISKEMKHPEKLTAKGKKQKIKQALAIYYSKKRRGEKV